jgi:transposase
VGSERVWALEDCRHVSGAFERFLLVHGERVIRVAARLTAGERRGARDRGKSDRIDAIAVARAALREGLEQLPIGELAGVELDIRLLIDHRERLVRMRVALYNDLLWHLHDLWPELEIPGCSLLSKNWTARISRRLARAEQTSRVRIARDELSHIRELTHTIDALENEISVLVAQVAPQLLAHGRRQRSVTLSRARQTAWMRHCCAVSGGASRGPRRRAFGAVEVLTAR